MINSVTEKYNIAMIGTNLFKTSTIPLFLNKTIADTATKITVVTSGDIPKALVKD